MVVVVVVAWSGELLRSLVTRARDRVDRTSDVLCMHLQNPSWPVMAEHGRIQNDEIKKKNPRLLAEAKFASQTIQNNRVRT